MNNNIEEQSVYEKWILEGYKYFAQVGPIDFSIKELSNQTGLSRTSFNYYFHTKEDYFDILIEHHLEETRKFGKIATQSKDNVVSGIMNAMEQLNYGIMFHVQLFNNRKIPKFDKAYLDGHEINFNNGILDWFLQFFKLKMSKEDGEKAFMLFVDVLNTRLNYLLHTNKNKSSFSNIFKEVIADFQNMLQAYTQE